MHWLDEPATISDTDRAAFERDGHVTLRGLMPAQELAAIGREITRLFGRQRHGLTSAQALAQFV